VPLAWETRQLPWPRDLPRTVAALDRAQPGLAWLDSAAPAADRTPRFSLLAWRPAATLEQFEHAPATLRTPAGDVLRESPSLWELWRTAHAELPAAVRGPHPLSPGWVGWIAFEAGRLLERLPEHHALPTGWPLARLELHTAAIVLDHADAAAWGVALPASATVFDNDPAATLEQLRVDWRNVCDDTTPLPAPPAATIAPEWPRNDYLAAVGRVLEYIRAGDTYQVNLAQRLRIEGLADPLAAYLAARTSNPAPYGAWLRWSTRAVASFSPELLLRLAGDDVLTSPIKGTRPRTHDPAADARHRADLLGSAKEAAELAMIVDLHRNDLGRVCTPGSVVVREPRRIEAHPSVFHTVADITGRLRADTQPGRPAGGLLPGGLDHRRPQDPRAGDHRRARALRPRRLHRLRYCAGPRPPAHRERRDSHFADHRRPRHTVRRRRHRRGLRPRGGVRRDAGQGPRHPPRPDPHRPGAGRHVDRPLNEQGAPPCARSSRSTDSLCPPKKRASASSTRASCRASACSRRCGPTAATSSDSTATSTA
jgi:para-aminobenzoate synthetase component 1